MHVQATFFQLYGVSYSRKIIDYHESSVLRKATSDSIARKIQSRVTRQRARNDRDVFVVARAIIDGTSPPITILIKQDRGKIEHTIGLIIDQSKICSLAGVIVAR